MLHPKYAAYLKMEQRKEIDGLLRGIIELLGSSEVVVDDRHSPKLWSRFLSGLLATPTARVELSPSSMKGGGSLSRRNLRRPAGHSAGSPGSGRGSPSLPSGSPSPAPVPGSSSSETHASSPASGISGTLSPPPPVLPASAPEDRYPARCHEAPSAAFNLLGGQSQHAYRSETNIGISHAPGQQGMYEMHNALHMDVPEFFHPPLPFDNELLQSIESMPDSSVWQNMPGKSL